jgi:hypothetical protein
MSLKPGLTEHMSRGFYLELTRLQFGRAKSKLQQQNEFHRISIESGAIWLIT